MKIEIIFTKEDIRRLLAEHCRKQFKVDPKNVAIISGDSDEKEQYFAKIEGDYQPD